MLSVVFRTEAGLEKVGISFAENFILMAMTQLPRHGFPRFYVLPFCEWDAYSV